GERQTCVPPPRRGAHFARHARERRVDALERLEHVDLPREEEIDFRRAAARDRLHPLEALDAVDRFLDRSRDRHHHLVDRRHAVVDAHEHARKIDFRKDRHRNRHGEVDARRDEGQDDEDDRLAVTRGPVLAGHYFGSPLSSSFSSSSPGRLSPGFNTRTFALSSRPRPPTVTTRSPGCTPATTAGLTTVTLAGIGSLPSAVSVASSPT